jgi:hypothetical protein
VDTNYKLVYVLHGLLIDDLVLDSNDQLVLINYSSDLNYQPLCLPHDV